MPLRTILTAIYRGDDNDSLNGFDADRKHDIEKMLWVYSLDEKNNIFNDPARTEFIGYGLFGARFLFCAGPYMAIIC